MQNEEPYILAYLRTLVVFKSETIPTILEYAILKLSEYSEMDLNSTQTIAAIVNAVETLTECLEFEERLGSKSSKSNTLQHEIQMNQDRDIFRGDLRWCTPQLIKFLSEFYQILLQM